MTLKDQFTKVLECEYIFSNSLAFFYYENSIISFKKRSRQTRGINYRVKLLAQLKF